MLFISLLLTLLPLPAVAADDDAVSWSQMDLPVEGKTGNWVLASGSGGISHLNQAKDGTLYCYSTPPGTSYTLFKSINRGNGWNYTGEVKNVIVDIAVAPDDSSVVYYATASTVYKSTDAGDSFSPLPYYPGGAGTGNISITAIDVVNESGRYIIAASTKDSDAGEFGGVYLYDEKDPDPLTGWDDTYIGNCDVYDVAFSPSPIVGQWHLAAATNDETVTVIKTKIGDTDWGSMISNTTVPLGTLVGAQIAFPDNYGKSQQDFTLIAGFNTGTGSGDAYIIYGEVTPAASSYVDFDIGRSDGLNSVDVSSIAVIGDSRSAVITAGTATGAQVYATNDGGATWVGSTKPPTGTAVTCIIPAKDFPTSGAIYAGTNGTEGAFSISTDCGLTWDQCSLIDTQISALVDFAPSPGYDHDSTVFVLTFGNSRHSLWRTEDGGTSWERVFSGALPGVEGIDYIRLSPEYGSNGKVLFLTGTSGGKPVLWKSKDNGADFTRPRPAYDPDSAASFNIMQCTVIDNSSLILGTFNGTNGLIYITSDAGWTYSGKVPVGTALLNSIAISPDYGNDKTILIGNKAGWTFLSDDGGASFEPLPDVSAAPLSGSVSVNFDPGFSQNGTIYAASGTADKGVYRYIIGHSLAWERIDTTLPEGSLLNQIALSAKGTLYAANSKAGMGIERSLNPAASGPVFETITHNLQSNTVLTGLMAAGDRLWTMDTANSMLMTLSDTLTSPVTLTAPADEEAGINTQNTKLDWEPLEGATAYEWQLDTDTGFTTIPTGFDDTTRSTSARLPELEPDTIYYWKVRATSPVLSPWSDRRSFTTTLSGAVSSPQLNSPAAGAVVPVRPVFQWDPVAGADRYELLIATDYTFAVPVMDKSGDNALPTTAWQCDANLEPDNTYYWKIRARNSESFSEWSNIGVFITEPDSTAQIQPTAESPLDKMSVMNTNTVTTTLTVTDTTQANIPPPVTTQVIQMHQTTPDWVRPLLYIGGGLILMIIIVLLVLVIALLRMGNRY